MKMIFAVMQKGVKMDDLISRQAAIEAIEMLLEQSEDDEHDKTWNKAIRGSINAVKHYVPFAQQWIPCSERLPKPVAPSQRREWFITSNTYGGVSVTCYEFEASPFKEGWQTDMTVLAWMPLPEPYKGEQ